MEAASKAKNTLRGWSDKNSGVIRDVEDDLFNGRTPEFEVDIEETKLLEHLIETGPKFHGVVSRGTETDLSDLKVGSNYETRAMSSFSEGASPPSEFADKALSVLIIPKSTRGISIRQFSANKMEEEVLVPKSKYRVKKIQKLKTSEGSVRGIILEEINE